MTTGTIPFSARKAGRSLSRRTVLALASACATATMLATAPAGAGDANAGLGLARQWCANCHLVERGRGGSDAAPPFTAIAADPDKDPAYLRTWLSTPHTQMPAMPLSRRDIDDLVAYITSRAP